MGDALGPEPRVKGREEWERLQAEAMLSSDCPGYTPSCEEGGVKLVGQLGLHAPSWAATVLARALRD